MEIFPLLLSFLLVSGVFLVTTVLMTISDMKDAHSNHRRWINGLDVKAQALLGVPSDNKYDLFQECLKRIWDSFLKNQITIPSAKEEVWFVWKNYSRSASISVALAMGVLLVVARLKRVTKK